MARRPRRKGLKKIKARQVARQQSGRDPLYSIAGQIGMRILSDPNALRVAGTLLETLGKVMQRTADSAKTTAPTTPTLPGGVFDLSTFRERKKGPSDG